MGNPAEETCCHPNNFYSTMLRCPVKRPVGLMPQWRAVHFLSAHDRKPVKKPLPLEVPTALRDKNPGNAEGCPKRELPLPQCAHPVGATAAHTFR